MKKKEYNKAKNVISNKISSNNFDYLQTKQIFGHNTLIKNYKNQPVLLSKNRTFYNKVKFVNNDLDQLKELFNNKEYNECEVKCLALINSNIKSKDIYMILGFSLVKQNKLDNAIGIYESAIKIFHNDIDFIINLGNAFKNNSQYLSAINQYQSALNIDKNSLSALINLSDSYNKISNFAEAKVFSFKAIELKPDLDKGYCNLGNAYLGMNKPKKALLTYEQGLKYNKNSNTLIHNKAFTLMLLKKFSEAIKIFENGFKNKNLNNSSLIDYGLCFFEIGKLKKSLTIYENALKYSPYNFKLFNNLGNLHSQLGNYKIALDYFKDAKKLQPNNVQIHYNIALNFYNETSYDSAINFCLSSIEINERFFDAYNLLALCYEEKQCIAKALENFEKSIELAPYSYIGYYNYGLFCLNAGKIHDALTFLTKSKDLGNTVPELDYLISMSQFNNLSGKKTFLHKLYHNGKLNKFTPEQISPILMPVLYSSQFSSDQIFELHKCFDKEQKNKKVDKNNNSKIRIGYVSADLNNHSVGYFFEPLIENHNLKKFEIFIYYNNNKSDEKNIHLQTYCKNWRNIFKKNDEYVFNLIKSDKIDILIDMSGHTARNRLEIFRQKPAFKQISWLGYPNSTGLKCIDYKFTDMIADPIGQSEMYHTEKLYRIPGSFICYKNDHKTNISNIKPLENNKYITFGSFNNISKISKTNLETWAKILKKVPNSQIVLKSQQYSSSVITKQFIEHFKKLDISQSRIKLLPYIPSTHGHLAMYNMIDISLDTFPYNGATTTMESLWMGVPVITLTGQTHVSRVSTSILENLNLQSLISKNLDDYIETTVNLSKNLDLLKYYQNSLRSLLENSVLCDGKGFARKIETAYEKIFSEAHY